jgi:hypothetical protein
MHIENLQFRHHQTWVHWFEVLIMKPTCILSFFSFVVNFSFDSRRNCTSSFSSCSMSITAPDLEISAAVCHAINTSIDIFISSISCLNDSHSACEAESSCSNSDYATNFSTHSFCNICKSLFGWQAWPLHCFLASENKLTSLAILNLIYVWMDR